MPSSTIDHRFQEARDPYAAFGVDVDAALDRLAGISLVLPLKQGMP